MSGYVYGGVQRLDDPLLGDAGRPDVCHGARGTIKGYGRHIRRGERPCDRCREAMNAYNRERRRNWENNPKTKSKDRERRKARARAWAALAKRYPAEFNAMMLQEMARVITEAATSEGERADG